MAWHDKVEASVAYASVVPKPWQKEFMLVDIPSECKMKVHQPLSSLHRVVIEIYYIVNKILKSIGYKIINFYISSYTRALINMKNCLVQCKHTKKNIHIKSCLTTIFHGIKFIHYHFYSEIPCNFLLYINYHIICQKLILHSIAKSCF